MTRGIQFSLGHTRIFKVEDTRELDVVVLILRVSQALLSNPGKEKWNWELFYAHFAFSSQYLFHQYVSFIHHRRYLHLAVDSVIK
jgi:hypothetical protein